MGVPAMMQTVYTSCEDVIYANLEAMSHYPWHKSSVHQVMMCAFNLEEAFDTVEILCPVATPFWSWNWQQVVKACESWYTLPVSSIRSNCSLSDPFMVEQWICQGSALSLLFSLVVDPLLRKMLREWFGAVNQWDASGLEQHQNHLWQLEDLDPFVWSRFTPAAMVWSCTWKNVRYPTAPNKIN